MHTPPLLHPIALAVLVALAASAPTARAQGRTVVDWVDWTASAAGAVSGVIATSPDTSATVTFSGNAEAVFLGNIPEPYWGPPSTYRGTRFENEPPNSDLIIIGGGPERMTLTFSEALVDPVIAIASLGLTTFFREINIQSSMRFEQPFEILSNGPNFYAGGQFTPFRSADESHTLLGIESSGVIRFRGTYTEIAWTSPDREVDATGRLVGTYLFTLGTSCSDYELSAPMTADTTVRRGCSAVTRGLFHQDRRLDVQGMLRAEGPYTVQSTLAVATGGSVNSLAGLSVDTGATASVAGSLAGYGYVDVKGRIESSIGSNLQLQNLTVTSVGSVSLGGAAQLLGSTSVNGLLQVAPGAGVMAALPLLVGGSAALLEVQTSFGRPGRLDALGGLVANSGATVRVGGELLIANTLDIDGATLQVLTGGSVTSSAAATLRGTVVNAGTLSFVGGGDVELAAGTLTNSGTLLISGGLVSMLPGAVFTNVGPGRVEVGGSAAGLVLLGAVASNLGTLAVTAHGSLELIGGTLFNPGRIEVGEQGSFKLMSGQLENSGTVVLGHEFINFGAVRNTGFMRFEPASGSATWANDGLIENEGSLRFLSGASLGSLATHAGTLLNNGSLRIEAGATLDSSGSLVNTGSVVVDGFLAITGGSFAQGASGSLTLNGTLRTLEFSVDGGSIGGTGTLEGSLVIGAGARALPGRSPGTLTVTDTVTLAAGSVLELEFSRGGAHDRLRAGRLVANLGSEIALRFVDGALPDLDQTFDALEVTGADESVVIDGATLTGQPGSISVDRYRRASGSGQTLGLAFAPFDVQRVAAADLGAADTRVVVFEGQQWLSDSELGRRSAELVVDGSFGLRRDARLRLDAPLQVGATGRLLNSSEALEIGARLAVRGEFLNRGATQAGSVAVEPGGRFTNRGRFTLGHALEAETVFINQGELRHEAGEWVNQTTGSVAPQLSNEPDALMVLAAPMRGAASLHNRGRLVVEAGGDVAELTALRQDGGSMQVDGRLQASELQVGGGLVSGRGHIDAPLTLRAPVGTVEPGTVVLRPGSASEGGWGGALAVSGFLEVGAGTALEFMISGADSNGHLSLGGDAQFDLAASLRFVLDGGYQPEGEASFSLIDFVPGATLFGLAEFTARDVAVIVRSGSGDTGWDGSWSLALRDDGIDLVLTATPVPEPGRGALLLAGAGLLAWLSRRRPR